MSAVKIHIKDDIYTIVDSDIAERLEGKSVWLYKNNQQYVQIWLNSKHVYLHRYVMNARSGQMVDHINGKPLDNRRCNLRFVTARGNSINRRMRPSSKTHCYRVSKEKGSNRFRSQVGNKSKMIHLGYYKSKVIAALISDRYVKKIHSIMPRLNFQSRIKRCHLPKVLRRTRGRIFSVVFIRRKAGAERHMTCRINVNKNVKGTGLLFEPEHMNLLPVYDVKKNDHRFIPLENVLCLTFRKKKYRLVN